MPCKQGENLKSQASRFQHRNLHPYKSIILHSLRKSKVSFSFLKGIKWFQRYISVSLSINVCKVRFSVKCGALYIWFFELCIHYMCCKCSSTLYPNNICYISSCCLILALESCINHRSQCIFLFLQCKVLHLFLCLLFLCLSFQTLQS